MFKYSKRKISSCLAMNLFSIVIGVSVPNVAATNQNLTQITCTVSPNLGFGSGNGNFTRGNFGGDFTPPDFGSGNFTPPQFGDGNFSIPEIFGNGTFTPHNEFVGSAALMNETLYADVKYVDGVVVPILQVSESQNQTVGAFDQNFSLVVPDYLIVGVPLDSSTVNDCPVLPTNITAGRNLQAGDNGVVLLSENNSAFFAAGVRDTVTSSASPNLTSSAQPTTSEQTNSGSLDFFYPIVVVVVVVIVAAAFVLRKRRKTGSIDSAKFGDSEVSGDQSFPFSYLSRHFCGQSYFLQRNTSSNEKSEICKYRKFVKKEFASKYTKEVLT